MNYLNIYYSQKFNQLFSNFIKKNINQEWDWTSILKNNNINKLEFNINDTKNHSSNKEYNYFDIPLDEETYDHLVCTPNRLFEWKIISSSGKITYDIIKNNYDLPWDWYEISKNSNITWEIINNNLKEKWSWKGISLNENITIDIVKNNMDKNWNWCGLSQNKNINYKSIEDNSDLPWEYKFVSLNENITFKYIYRNMDKIWDWKNLSRNTMQNSKKRYIKNQIYLSIILSLKNRLDKDLIVNIYTNYF